MIDPHRTDTRRAGDDAHVDVPCANLWGVRRLLSFLSPFCVFALFLVLGPAPSAFAVCDCAALSLADSLVSQQVAFVGELTAPAETFGPLVVYTFRVDGVYKGETTLETKVGTVATTDDCGIGSEAQPGRWLVFGSRFPDETGMLFMSACTATGLLPADQPIPTELGEPRLPADVAPPPEAVAPVLASPPPIVWKGLPDWRPPVARAAVAFVGIGLLARVLAGRRRRTVV